MVGAGIFVALAPAAAAAGSGLLIGPAVAAAAGPIATRRRRPGWPRCIRSPAAPTSTCWRPRDCSSSRCGVLPGSATVGEEVRVDRTIRARSESRSWCPPGHDRRLERIGQRCTGFGERAAGGRGARAGFPGMEPVGGRVPRWPRLLAAVAPSIGVSRTTLAMARDRHLPHALAAVQPRYERPHRAEVVVGVVVAAVAAVVDVRGRSASRRSRCCSTTRSLTLRHGRWVSESVRPSGWRAADCWRSCCLSRRSQWCPVVAIGAAAYWIRRRAA